MAKLFTQDECENESIFFMVFSRLSGLNFEINQEWNFAWAVRYFRNVNYKGMLFMEFYHAA